MRVVALEEHYSIPALMERIPPAVLKRRGLPAPANMPPRVRNAQTKLADIGEDRIADMDKNGISVQVLSFVLHGADLLDPDEGIDFAKQANNTLSQAISRYSGRLAGFAHLPMTAPEAAADELERAVNALGMCGALISGTTQDQFLDNRTFEPVLSRAEQLDVPIYLHPGIPPEAVRKIYFDGFDPEVSFMLSGGGWGWHSETAIHVLRLVLAGVFDRHPRLKIIIGHMGEGLPAMLARCDQVFGSVARLARPVSRAIVDQVYVTTSGMFTLPPFMALLMTFGVDRILFSVDYPFAANSAGRAFLDALPVSDADKEKIAHRNADRLLKLHS
jgi:predicted TIM-barrel fold metal-dependent hydrolase